MRIALLTLLVLGAARSSLAVDLHPHFLFRHPYYCAHYDYRLNFDYRWHAAPPRPTAFLHSPGPPAEELMPGMPSVAPPMLIPPNPLGSAKKSTPASPRHLR